MSGNEEPTSAYSAADALAHAEEHPLEIAPQDDEPEPEKPAETETPEGDEEDEEEEAKEDEESEEEDNETDESEPEDDEVPKLDPLLEELAKGNPKAEKRVKEIAAGLQKLKTESKELKTELEKSKPQVEFLEGWNKALANPETAGKALEQLVLSVAQHHKTTPGQLLGILSGSTQQQKAQEEQQLLPERDEYGRTRETWERKGYASEKEMQLEDALKTVNGELASLKGFAEQMQKERLEGVRQAEHTKFIDETAPKTIKKLEKLENGWKVTRAMVEKALTDFPQLRDDPARAVKAAYPDELKKHHIGAGKSGKTRGPEMPADARGKGRQPPEPRRFSAADALAMVDGS